MYKVASVHNMQCRGSVQEISGKCFSLLPQMFDFRSVSESPLCVTYHPAQKVFVCGFSSGAVRVFHTHTTSLLAEHR